MKKYVATLAAALMALLGLAVLAPAAQAYPTPILTFSFGIKGNTVVSGRHFSATVNADIKCSPLTLSWSGQNSSANGSTLKTTLVAPVVSKKTVIAATATCSYTSVAGAAGHAIAPSSAVQTATANITVLPLGGGGKLPNTGGPSLGWLIGGVAALLAGAGAMIAGRRRTGAVPN